MSYTDIEEFESDLEELSSAEDFLTYFEIPFDSKVVYVNRLHIMQRFHDYLEQSKENTESWNDNADAMAAVYKKLLEKSYMDFVESDALTEKVFKVFKTHGPQSTFVSVDTLFQK